MITGISYHKIVCDIKVNFAIEILQENWNLKFLAKISPKIAQNLLNFSMKHKNNISDLNSRNAKSNHRDASNQFGGFCHSYALIIKALLDLRSIRKVRINRNTCLLCDKVSTAAVKVWYMYGVDVWKPSFGYSKIP